MTDTTASVNVPADDGLIDPDDVVTRLVATVAHWDEQAGRLSDQIESLRARKRDAVDKRDKAYKMLPKAERDKIDAAKKKATPEPAPTPDE